jgi:hypothetical protein
MASLDIPGGNCGLIILCAIPNVNVRCSPGHSPRGICSFELTKPLGFGSILVSMLLILLHMYVELS